MTPNYTIYLSITFDLEPWNPLIHNNVSSYKNALTYTQYVYI